MAIYYVTKSGSDSNNGLSRPGWLTIGKAAATMIAGDTVLVDPGTYSERTSIGTAGSSGNPITYQATADGVICQGFNVSANYIRIDRFDITNTPVTDYSDFSGGSGIFCSSANCTFSNLYVHDLNSVGIFIGTGSSNCTATNNRVRYSVDSCMYVRGSNHVVSNNDLSHCVQTHAGMSNSGDANGIGFFGTNHVIKNNWIHDISFADTENSTAHIDLLVTWGSASDITIENNRLDCWESSGSAPILGAGIYFNILPNTNSVARMLIRNNVVTTNSLRWSPLIHVDDSTSDLGPLSDIWIYNNTFIRTNGPGLTGSPGGCYGVNVNGTGGHLSNVLIRNNAFCDCGGGTSGDGYIGTTNFSPTVNYNGVWVTSGSAPAGGPFANDVWMVDPQFSSLANRDFKLKPGSPYRDAGTRLSDVPSDANGVLRPQNGMHDIGAFEYVQQMFHGFTS